MRAAVIFSPGAGQKENFLTIGKKLESLFGAGELITCPGSFGADYLPGAKVCAVDRAGGYVEVLGRITRTLLGEEPQLLVSVGGDGIASYIADAMFTAGAAVPMMGVAAGTANVGPIVCVSADELDDMDASRWEYFTAGAVEVATEHHIAYAFNDVVIGNTLLGTVDGEVVNLSARAMAENGRKEICRPSSEICGADFRIAKNGAEMAHFIAKPGQIIVSPLDRDRLAGRAVYGALCSAAYTDCKAAVALTEQVMISAEAEDAGMNSFCPMEHLLFGPEDVVELSGLTEDADLVLDGNPYLRDGDAVKLRYMPELVTIAVPARKA